MPIINKAIPFLGPNDQIEYREQNSIFTASEFRGQWYYWVEFANWECLKNLHKVIPPDMLEKIKRKNIILVPYHSHEGNTNVVEPVYQHAVIELGIPEDKIHFYTESSTIKTVINEVAAKLGKKPFRCFSTTMFERFCQYSIIRLENELNTPLITLESKKYEKKFLNFNRRWRWHRPALVAHMYLENILDLGYVSLGTCESSWGWDNVWHLILSTHSHHPDIRQKLIDNKDKIFSIPQMYLDQENLEINHNESLKSTLDMYRNTYFSVITETNFYFAQEPALFLTEKIFKALAHKHPFVVLGRPKTLSFLKDIGYKTFDSIIDESYDDEVDDVTRMMKILNEIKRLCYLSESELEEFLVKAREICDYNYNVLKTKKVFIREITDDPRY
jgi:hypothetical protein